jgi:ABC-type nitrate/sulfonate/bicarbonate transport system permease component
LSTDEPVDRAVARQWRVEPTRARLTRAMELRRVADVLRAEAGLIGLAGVFAVWYVTAAILAEPAVLPSPQAVFGYASSRFFYAPELSAYGLEHSGIGPNLLYTVENVFLAVGVGTCIGSLLGLASARSPIFQAILNPIVSGATAVPFLVMAPFFLVWFGVGRLSGLLLVTLYTCVILIIFSQRAVLNLNPVYESNAAVLGAGRRAVLFDILLPATIPEMLGGLRIALAGAWGLEAVAELLGSNSGIGMIIRVIAGQADTMGLMAAVVALSTVAVLCDGAVVFAVRTLTRWRAT